MIWRAPAGRIGKRFQLQTQRVYWLEGEPLSHGVGFSQGELGPANRLGRAFFAEDVDAPVSGRRTHATKHPAHSAREFKKHRQAVDGFGRRRMRHHVRLHRLHRTGDGDECIKDVYARGGEAAARGVTFKRAPAREISASALVAEMAFHMQYLSEFAARRDASQVLHRSPKTLVVPEPQSHLRATAGIDRALSIDRSERKWLLAKHGFPCRGRGNDLLHVQ